MLTVLAVLVDIRGISFVSNKISLTAIVISMLCGSVFLMKRSDDMLASL